MEKRATDSSGEEAYQRVVRGGATSFPREVNRPSPGPLGEMLMDTLHSNIKAPLITVLLIKLLFPTYQRWIKTFLARGGTQEAAFARLITGMHLVIYFGSFLFFEFGERFGPLAKYKLFRTEGQEPSYKQKAATILEFVFGTAIGHVFFLPRGLELLQRYGSPKDYINRLPSLWKMYGDIVISANVQIYVFAVLHRLFHHGPLYRAFHRKHHEYVGTVSIAAENAHIVEALVSNFFPVLIGPLLRGMHPFVLAVYLLWRLQETYETHSGFCFYGSFLHKLGFTNAEQAAYHDAHHLLNRGNFSMEIVDHFMGTQDKWLALGRAKGYVEWSERLKELRRKRQETGNEEESTATQ